MNPVVEAPPSVIPPHQRLLRQGSAGAVDFALTLGGILCGVCCFALFVLVQGLSPWEVLGNVYRGAFGSSFSWGNTLTKAAPLLLTSLCTAIPARLGLIIIGNEGALLLGGLSAAWLGAILPWPGFLVLCTCLLAGTLVGALWIGLAGMLRQWRGVNETISSLLLYYVAAALFLFLVEGPLRDPASLNKPTTPPIAEAACMGTMDGLGVHYGLIIGCAACILVAIWLSLTAHGFACRVAGGNDRTARLVGLPLNKLILLGCLVAGGAAGLAGSIEVMAVHQSASSSLQAGLGFAGILVAFTARHQPLNCVWVALLFGGIEASGGLLQRRHDLPDAAAAVFQGLIVISMLASETLRASWLPRIKARLLAGATT